MPQPLEPSHRLPRPQAVPLLETAGTGAAVGELHFPLHYEPDYRYPLVAWFGDPASGGSLAGTMTRISLRNQVGVGLTSIGSRVNSSGFASPATSPRWDASVYEGLVRSLIATGTAAASIHLGRVFVLAEGVHCEPLLDLAVAGRLPGIAGLACILDRPLRLAIAGRSWNPASVGQLFLQVDEPGDPESRRSAHAQWRVLSGMGFDVLFRGCASGTGFRGTALANVDRWIMQFVTGQPTFDRPSTAVEPSCLAN